IDQICWSVFHEDCEEHMSEAFIYDAVRTPRGKNRDGALHSVKPIDLVTGLIDAVRERNPELDDKAIDDLVLGVVSPVGEQGGDIARTAALVAGLDESVAGVQVNRFCASGLEAVNLAAQKVGSGFENLVLAGGVESMSRVPLGSDGGAWAQDPTTNFDTYFVPRASAPTSSPPPRASAATTSTPSRQNRRSGRPTPGRTGTSRSRSCPSRTSTASPCSTGTSTCVPAPPWNRCRSSTRRLRSSPPRPDSTRWPSRSTTGLKRSTTSTPPRPPRASSTAPAWSSSATPRWARRWA